MRYLCCAIGMVIAGITVDLNPAFADNSASRPNVIIIVADDLGYGDVGAFGNEFIPTPNIDRIAAEGVRLTNAYVTSPVCSPSRAGFQSGRYPARSGQDFNPRLRETPEVSLPLSETTIAERVSRTDHVSGLVGKWHLGREEAYDPLGRGYTEYFGFGLGVPYLPELKPGDGRHIVEGETERERRRQVFIRGRDRYVDEVHKPVLLTDESISFIERHHETPFFLVVTYHTPHTPIEAPKAYMDRVSHIEDYAKQVYAAMILALDDGVGRILQSLDDAGIEEQTFVGFFSDNGCPSYLEGVCSNGPFSGFKRELREGGIRVPMAVRYPGVIPPGSQFDKPVNSLDLMVTALALTGADLTQEPALDGRNMLDELAGRAEPTSRPLYWRSGRPFAIRDGRYKLLVAPATSGGEAVFLFDLEADPGETNNLAAEQPELVAQLRSAWDTWNAENAPPRWEARTVTATIDGIEIEMDF